MPFIQKSDLCKFSLEEAQLLSGKTDVSEACDHLHEIGTKIIAITLGAQGTFVSTSNVKKTIPSMAVTPVDTTGAGDAFIGCLLYQISCLDDIQKIMKDESVLFKMVEKANKAGAITTTNFGAIESLPNLNQLES